jgi:hypothetical protein
VSLRPTRFLHKLKAPPPGPRYDLACALAELGAATPPGPERAALLDRAMDELRETWTAGFRNLEHIKADPDLTPLSSRLEFQLLSRDAAFPSRLFAH